ncbi:Uncharacterised protein [Clostridium paraputrificum]|uniref:hypothetical protein n=1 Tax=Clostridium paraputrificum TaxID=29363 RepID=UPI0006C015FC|nr:hypothetical protein [Clostridium paraputrificum]CUP99001.1 Uncharacterised protein [Clostridium paraputrificum]
MEEFMRRDKLKAILDENPYMTGIRIKYRGEMEQMNAYKIPLEYLIYNKYNGRIGSAVKSFEKEKHVLNPEREEDKKIIEKLLWNSKIDRNKSTEKSLAKDGQQKYGIVTRNGIIIDGNRRASILNRIYRKRNDEYKGVDVAHSEYFIAVILPEDAEQKDIIELETRYQMGVDEKVDYNATEKYLKCADLKEAGFEVEDIADMMGEKTSKIREYLDILDLMNEYLETYNYSGIYTRLEKREGPFVDLRRYLQAYKAQKGNATWSYEEDDVSDLELICFDYIRAKYEGKEFRDIANTSKNQVSIFSDEKIWKEFKDKHFSKVDGIEEKDIEEIRKDCPNEDLTNLLEKRDNDWEDRVKDDLKGNLFRSVRKYQTLQEANMPEKILNEILDMLDMINTDIETFYNSDVIEELVGEINSLTYEFKKIIKSKRKKKI